MTLAEKAPPRQPVRTPTYPTHDVAENTGVPPRMNSSADTVRLECEHWKPYMGW